MTTHQFRNFRAACIAAIFALFLGVWSTPARAQTAKPYAPKTANLSLAFTNWGLPIKSQGRRDTCAVFTLAGALEYALARGTGQVGVRLSEEYLNWAADDITQITFDGASYEDLISAFDKWGISAEQYMPYAARYDENTQPSEIALESARQVWELGFKRHWVAERTSNGLKDSHITAMRRVLMSGWPLCAYGRDHSILLVGFQDDPRMSGGGQFITRNSATQRYETIFYAAAKAEFGSVLWIELTKSESEKSQ